MEPTQTILNKTGNRFKLRSNNAEHFLNQINKLKELEFDIEKNSSENK